MDLTNRYILMCQKALEIQDLWRPKQCDIIIEQEMIEAGLSFCKQGASEVQVVNLYYDEGTEQYQQECEELRNIAVWLPRQDQLQYIIEPDESKVCLIIHHVLSDKYYYSPKDTYIEPHKVFYSMEQLWLAYVLKAKYNKIWNEEDWVTGKSD
ncbi:MAG: hypothetical protein RDU01_08210 [Thermodesulfovibrionales bacterium]|nr:hypothetical protein [Thermodesulfovibrionales bacterium]